MKLFVAGLNWRTAPVSLREPLAVAPAGLCDSASRLKQAAGLAEVALLSTCNRVEIYGTTSHLNGNTGALFQHLAPSARHLDPQVYYFREGAGAVAHLFAVTGGLDSMVMGETEITGQVKEAYDRVRAAGLTGPVLNTAFQSAFNAAKAIRTHTRVGRGATSVGRVAVELAERIFGEKLAQRTVLLFGTGQISEACARHLAKRGVQVTLVTNRCFDRAQNLAAQLGGRAARLEDRAALLARADMVITATRCPSRLLCRKELEALMRARGRQPLCLIDLAVPRNIDPDVNQLEDVYLYDIDDLQGIVRKNVHQRQNELDACRGIIARKVEVLWAKLEGSLALSDRSLPQLRPGWLLAEPLAPAAI